MRSQEIHDSFVGCLGLVGGKNVAGARDYDQLGVRDASGDQLSVGRWNQLIGFAVDNQSGRCDLRQAAVRFPGHDSLQLAQVAVGGGIPFDAKFPILGNPFRRSSRRYQGKLVGDVST